MPFLDRLLPEHEIIFQTRQLNPDKTQSSSKDIKIQIRGLIPQCILVRIAANKAYSIADRSPGISLSNPTEPTIINLDKKIKKPKP
jgi:hypothetical protein